MPPGSTPTPFCETARTCAEERMLAAVDHSADVCGLVYVQRPIRADVLECLNSDGQIGQLIGHGNLLGVGGVEIIAGRSAPHACRLPHKHQDVKAGVPDDACGNGQVGRSGTARLQPDPVVCRSGTCPTGHRQGRPEPCNRAVWCRGGRHAAACAADAMPPMGHRRGESGFSPRRHSLCRRPAPLPTAQASVAPAPPPCSADDLPMTPTPHPRPSFPVFPLRRRPQSTTRRTKSVMSSISSRMDS
jgi:hypothetical protein